jgi:hypothetical protein
LKMGPSYLATRGSTTVSRRCERRQGARLVLFHEPAVTDHVGSRNGCKTAPDASFGHLSVSFQKERRAEFHIHRGRLSIGPDVRVGSWLRENGKGETALRKFIPLRAISRGKCSVFRVPGVTSEKFVLAIVLLDAFLHGQGHERSCRPTPKHVGSPCRCGLAGKPAARIRPDAGRAALLDKIPIIG